VLDVGHRRRQAALVDDVMRWPMSWPTARVAPDDADDRNVDLGQDVVGIFNSTNGVASRIRMAITMNVYGRFQRNVDNPHSTSAWRQNGKSVRNENVSWRVPVADSGGPRTSKNVASIACSRDGEHRVCSHLGGLCAVAGGVRRGVCDFLYGLKTRLVLLNVQS
jgi:hypothetical protein